MSRTPKQYVVKGRPVPFITRWSGETEEFKKHSREQTSRMTRPDGTARVTIGHIPEEWDFVAPYNGRPGIVTESLPGLEKVNGWHWNAMPNKRGVGKPEWSQVHEGRQRSCMKNWKCQVCGTPIEHMPSDERPFVWLTASSEPGASRSGSKIWTTSDAPTCPPCALVAVRECPHLQKYRQWYLVRDAAIAAVRCRYKPADTTEMPEQIDIPLGLDNQTLADVQMLFIAGQYVAALVDADPLTEEEALAILRSD